MTTTNTTLPALTPEQKETIKTAAALVRITWQVVGTDRDAVLNTVQQAVTDTLLFAFDRNVVTAIYDAEEGSAIYDDPDNASTARALTKLIREAQNKVAADAARGWVRYAR